MNVGGKLFAYGTVLYFGIGIVYWFMSGDVVGTSVAICNWRINICVHPWVCLCQVDDGCWIVCSNDGDLRIGIRVLPRTIR